MGKFERQVAKYLFAEEIKNTVIQYTIENEDSQFSSMHAVTPTGQDVGRVFICGTLTEVEDIGNDNPYFKGRLVDQTGAISIYAGNYQPDALAAMEIIATPSYVAVVGKIAMFTTEDGAIIPSVRPESITEIDEDVIRTWVFMTAKNMIELIEDPTKTKAKEMAVEQYGDVRADYNDMAVNALESLLDQNPGQENDEDGTKD